MPSTTSSESSRSRDRGYTARVKVGDAVQNLAEIKQGDQIVVHFTGAVALSVEK